MMQYSHPDHESFEMAFSLFKHVRHYENAYRNESGDCRHITNALHKLFNSGIPGIWEVRTDLENIHLRFDVPFTVGVRGIAARGGPAGHERGLYVIVLEKHAPCWLVPICLFAQPIDHQRGDEPIRRRRFNQVKALTPQEAQDQFPFPPVGMHVRTREPFSITQVPSNLEREAFVIEPVHGHA